MDRSPLLVTDPDCPPLCFSKALLFISVCVFILYLPLGDPDDCKSAINCCECSKQSGSLCLCCLCSVYKCLIRVLDKLLELADCLVHICLDVLHRVKLKFYGWLEKYDKNDLCSSVCSYQENIQPIERPCRCSHHRQKRCKT